MHKQLLAYHLLLVSVVSLITALNKQEAATFRLVGLVIAVVAFSMQILAESATSMVLGIFAISALIFARFLWVPMSRFRHLRSLTFMAVLFFAVTGILVFVSIPQNTLLSDFLNLVGKEGTLTGRTMIWDAADEVAQHKPIFGHGLGAYWHPDVGSAQTLAELTHSAPGTNISFHSVYWETRVHLGWVGFLVLAFALAWAALRTFRLWLGESSFINTGLLVMVAITGTTILTESYLAGPFNMIVTSFYFGALSSFDMSGRKVWLRQPAWDVKI